MSGRREQKKVATFDGAPPPGTIHFGIGQPSSDLLPSALLAEASQRFFGAIENVELNYGVVRGDERFLQTLSHFLTNEYGARIDPDSLMTTAGNSQALDFIATHFTSPGDTVFVERPSYFLAFQIFRDHGLNIVEVATDDSGLNIAKLTSLLDQHQPKFIYTIPTFHNPAGTTMTLERREALLELSIERNFLIVADEVYHSLSFGTSPPPAFGTLTASESVISIGSFSKILAPALRLGWLHAAPRLIHQCTQSGMINSGGAMNHFTSHIVRQAIDSGLQDQHLEVLRRTLRRRRDAMQNALSIRFSDIARWNEPQGGYFFWVELQDGFDASRLQNRAAEFEIGFQAGDAFSIRETMKNFIRLCFAHYDEADILKGVIRLRQLIDSDDSIDIKG